MTGNTNVVRIDRHHDHCNDCTLAHECLSRNDGDSHDKRFDIPVMAKVHQRGAHIFCAGEPFTAVHMVRSGVIKTYLISSSGEEQVIGFHFSGELIGLDALESDHYVSYAQALDTASVCALPYEKLLRLSRHSKSVQLRLMKQLGSHIKTDGNLLLLLGQKSADERIARLLLDIADAQQQRGYSGLEFTLPMSRADIGSYFALAVETVSRVLTRLKTRRAIAVDRDCVQIIDRKLLTEIADGFETPTLHNRRAH